MSDPPHPSLSASTRWSLVLSARQHSFPESEKALGELCQIYWPAVYAFVRRQVRHIDEAQDLTQAFFTQLLEKDLLAIADPSRGRFRSFLLTAVSNFLNNQRERDRALKRGGGQQALSLNFQTHDGRPGFEPSDSDTPERHFERQWALALLEQAMTRLRGEYASAGKETLFEHCKDALAQGPTSMAEIASRLGISENAAKVATHRLRKRYRELLRQEVGHSLADPAEIDDEIRHLFTALRP
jgi:RNA polymerase sigma-70 factor (ECF subfamily)